MFRLRTALILICTAASACATPKTRDFATSEGADASTDAGNEELVLTTTSLPNAAYNVAYSVKLEYEGGTNEGIIWSVISGSLPTGVTLSDTGTLSGTPTASGAFDVTIQVKDSYGTSANQQLALTVTRKKWLAYISNEKTAAQDRLYLVDISNSTLARSEVTASFADNPGFTIPWYGFAPDGNKLAVIINTHLYVTDVSGNTPGQLQQVDRGSGITWSNLYGSPWSPDSKSVAYSEVVNSIANIMVANVTAGSPGTPAQAGSFGYLNDFFWMNPQTLILAPTGLSDTLNYARFSNGAWSALLQVTSSTNLHYLGLVTVAPSGKRFLGSYYTGSTNTYVVEPETNLVSINVGLAGKDQFSYDLEMMRYNSAIYSVDAALGTPLVASIGDGAVAWANTNKWLAVAPTTSGQSIQWVNPVATPVATVDAPSSDTLGAVLQISYAPNDSWVGLRTGSGVYAAVANSSGIAAPTLLSTALPTAATLTSFAFAPNSGSVLYLGQQSTSGIDELYWVNLATGTPTAPRKVSLSLASSINVNSPSWSSDSSTIGYLEKGPASNPNSALWVANILDADSNPLVVTPAIVNCTSTTACNRIRDFAFQP